MQGRTRNQCGRKDFGHLPGPEKLVFEVNEPARPSDRFPKSASDAALAVGREWIAASTMRVGAQDLDRVRSTWRGVGVHRRQDACLAMRVAQQVVHEPEWIAAERPMVIPSFAKAIFEVPHGRAVDRQLRVVPGWSWAVDRRHRLVLRVAFMAGVVAPAVTCLLY